MLRRMSPTEKSAISSIEKGADEEQAPSKKLLRAVKTADDYIMGDCYKRLPVAQQWELNTKEYPYLAHVKALSSSWRQLRYLADWMEISTVPQKWRDLVRNPHEREERAHRTNVTLLEYMQESSQPSKHSTFTDANSLAEALSTSRTVDPPHMRIFFVEDLSRQVIEQLGSRFDIDPLFFREHIMDHAWFNTRAPWAMAPTLQASMNHRKWFCVRNTRLRYFESKESFERGREEARAFNVGRRPDDDRNHWFYADKPGSIVSMMRTKISIWIDQDPEKGGAVAVILVDPTIKEGYPLWQGYSNWTPTPSFASPDVPESHAEASAYEDLIHWTLKYPWFPSASPQSPSSNSWNSKSDLQRLVQPALYTTCAKWLVVCEYLKARLGQIEWELEEPGVFRSKGDAIDSSLRKLHTWQRVIPLFREMVTETLKQGLPAAARLTSSGRELIENDIAPDYKRVSLSLEELQSRVETLTGVVAAQISTEDSRRGLEENHNLARLTWLATLFIPMSFVSGLFSMQTDIATMKLTFGWYFATAIPLSILTMLIALNVHRWIFWGAVKREERLSKRRDSSGGGRELGRPKD